MMIAVCIPGLTESDVARVSDVLASAAHEACPGMAVEVHYDPEGETEGHHVYLPATKPAEVKR